MKHVFYLFLIFLLVQGCSSSDPGGGLVVGNPSDPGNQFGPSNGGIPGEGGTGGNTPGDEAGDEGGTPGEGGSGGYSCVDGDNDGYGVGCILGNDCDDSNPNFYDICPNCAVSNDQGCPCYEEGQSVLCYGADQNLAGIGACQLGDRTCTGGYWTGCIGEVLPTVEVCDFLDNDCNGQVDEGVLSPCGDCDKFCTLDKFGSGTNEPFNPQPEDSAGVELTPEGWITLSENAYTLHYIWIANSGENTVSKLDTNTGMEIARYSVCNNPSRTSVDKNGDCWVGCRNDGKVAKIRNGIEKCIDKNGNGVIDTSTDLNGDGTIQPDEMMNGLEDECILFSNQIGGASCIRAVGVDPDNNVWVGAWNQAKLYKLDSETGNVLAEVAIGANPYGLAVDQQGVVWVAGRGGSLLVRVDANNGNQVSSYSPGGCFEPYGITIDSGGDVWIGNCCCGNNAWRYGTNTGVWTSIATASRPRGIAASTGNYVYVANDDSNGVSKININNNTVEGTANLGSNRFPVGIAVDSNGFIWAVNQNSSSASKIDPNTLQVIHEQPVGSGPYTYSDMTGATFFHDIAPEGYFDETYGGWEGVRVVWKSILVDYFAPAGTYIDVQVRIADTLEELEVADWSEMLGPFPPNNFPVLLKEALGNKKAKLLQVRVWLYTDNEEVKPYVKNIELEYTAESEG